MIFNYPSDETNSNLIQLPTTKNVRGHVLVFFFFGFMQLKHFISMPKNNMKPPKTQLKECGGFSWVHLMKPEQTAIIKQPIHDYWAHIRRSCVSMHRSSVIYVVEKFASSPDAIIIPKCIIIDGYHIYILMDNVPSNLSVFKQTLPNHIFYDIPSIVDESVISFFPLTWSTMVISLSNKQILGNLLSEEGIFLPEISCFQLRGLQSPFCP